MAHLAFLFRRIALMTVKAPARRTIRCDLLMTIEALAGLRLPRKCRMAAEAIRL
jgi:hypothetical protein